MVNSTDQIIARHYQTNPLTMLRLITTPTTEPPKPKMAWADVDWLYEFEQTNAKGSPVKKADSHKATVDLLMATWAC